MNETELNKLIKEGESERLEFKRSTGQRTEAAKTVCAMLNGAGGMILFGVTDGGEPVGQQVSTRTLADILLPRRLDADLLYRKRFFNKSFVCHGSSQ